MHQFQLNVILQRILNGINWKIFCCIRRSVASVETHNDLLTITCTTEFLIRFKVWAKLAQEWLVCAPLGIHHEPINVVSDNIIIINCAIWPKERTVLCQIRSSLGQWCAI